MNKSALINKRSLEDQAADLIREDIVNGELTPGTRLVETSLAKEYGLSRGTIRIALHQLGTESLITQVPYAGWSVAQLTGQDLWELSTLRTTLEGMAARLAAEHITAAGAEQLKAVYADLLECCAGEDFNAITRADLALHKAIVDLSGHGRLARQYQLIENQLLSYISVSNQSFDPAVVGSSHRALVDAICEGRVDDAAAEAVHSITDAEQLQQVL